MLLASSGGELGAMVLSAAAALLAVILFAIGLWSFKWPKAKGLIIVSIHDQEWVHDTDFQETRLWKKDSWSFAYSFEVGGVQYAASAIRPNGDLDWNTSTAGFSSAAAKARWYREGKEVDVFYCPLWPKLCCLKPGGVLMPVVLLFASAGIYFIGRMQ